MAITKSPKYPNFSLRQAMGQIEKIFKADRRNPMDREVVVKHMGYRGASGAADKAAATMVQYGLLGYTGKSELKVTQLAVDILHPADEKQRKDALARAAFTPPLFKELQSRFPDGVSDGTLRSYLVRSNFLDRAINPIISAFNDTCAFLKQEGAFESGANADSPDEQEELEDNSGSMHNVVYGGAEVGDLVQWESAGALQFERAKRVRLVSTDGQFVAVDGSTTGIPMHQVIVEERAASGKPQPPMFPLGFGELAPETPNQPGEAEWMRNRLGEGTSVRLLVTGDMGPKQIGKLIKLLEAQRAVLEDDDDEDLIG